METAFPPDDIGDYLTQPGYTELGTISSSGQAIWQRDKSGSYSDSGHTQGANSIWVVGSDLWIVVTPTVGSAGYKLQKWTIDIHTDPNLCIYIL